MGETSVFFPREWQHLDSRETKQMFPEGVVIKCIV